MHRLRYTYTLLTSSPSSKAFAFPLHPTHWRKEREHKETKFWGAAVDGEVTQDRKRTTQISHVDGKHRLRVHTVDQKRKATNTPSFAYV